MRHPTDGTLRRLVDEPAGVADADREHVAGCPGCLSGLAAAQDDAAAAGAALRRRPRRRRGRGVVPPVAARSPATAAGGRPRLSPPAGGVPALRSPVVAAVGVVVLLTGAGAAAAADWLQIFRTEQIAPVTVTQADLVELPDLSAYGELEVTEEADVREVADAAAAEEATGLSVPRVSELPRGVTGEPTYQVGDQVERGVHLLGRQGRAGRRGGRRDAAATARRASTAASSDWPPARGSPRSGRTAAACRPWSWPARSHPPSYSSGVPFETARDYLLSLPGLPEDVASQLRSFSGDGTTLPLPVPAGQVTSSDRRRRRRAGHGAHLAGRHDGGRGLGGRRRGHRGGRLAEHRRGAVGGPRAAVVVATGPPPSSGAALDAAERLLAELPALAGGVVLGPAQAVPAADRGRRRVLHRRPRRGGRPARTERRRQDHRHQDPARSRPARRRRGAAARAAGAATRTPGPASATCRSSSATSRGSPPPRC